jgi:hypothetical protein
MARWQLTEPHYLNTRDTKWEFETKNRTTGRSERKQFNVPTHLDPNIEQDWNYVDRLGNNIIDGKIIVCWPGKGEGKDIEFEGPPTPGMLPLDDEAKAESAKYSWKPTAGLDENSQFNSFAQQTLIQLTSQLKDVAEAPKQQIEGLSDFMKTMTEMMKVQTETLALLAGRKVEVELQPTEEEELARIAAELDLQPIIDDAPPLPAPPKRPREAAGRRA